MSAIQPGLDAQSALPTIDVHTQHAVEQFLYTEAELLDQHRYDEWIELFTEDTRYWMPTRMNRVRRERHLEIAGEDESAFIDDDKYFLRGRVRRYTSGLSWSEEPPSRTRRLITNVRVSPSDDGELAVASNFCVYRSRSERHEDMFIGERFDVLRRTETTKYPYAIAFRKIVVDQTVLLAPNISIFL